MRQAFLACALIGFSILPGQSSISKHASQVDDLRSNVDVVNYVVGMFFRLRQSGSISISGSCSSLNGASDVVPDYIPEITMTEHKNVAEALAMLSDVDRNIVWRRERDGLINVADGKVPHDILGIKLHTIRFEDRAEPALAVADILSTPQVRSYFRQHGIELGLYTRMGGLTSTSTSSLPKLSVVLKNVTVEEALNYVARFYPALWVYSDCKAQTHRVVVITALQMPRKSTMGNLRVIHPIPAANGNASSPSGRPGG